MTTNWNKFDKALKLLNANILGYFVWNRSVNVIQLHGNRQMFEHDETMGQYLHTRLQQSRKTQNSCLKHLHSQGLITTRTLTK